MTLVELIQIYRATHNMSQRQFASNCGLSNGYISMLERGFNPKTKKPIRPTIPAMKKIATGMGMSLHELFESVEDTGIDMMHYQADYDQRINGPIKKAAPVSPEESERAREFAELFAKLTEKEQTLVIAQIKGILAAR